MDVLGLAQNGKLSEVGNTRVCSIHFVNPQTNSIAAALANTGTGHAILHPELISLEINNANETNHIDLFNVFYSRATVEMQTNRACPRFNSKHGILYLYQVTLSVYFLRRVTVHTFINFNL